VKFTKEFGNDMFFDRARLSPGVHQVMVEMQLIFGLGLVQFDRGEFWLGYIFNEY
jgi:hypothetical protein